MLRKIGFLPVIIVVILLVMVVAVRVRPGPGVAQVSTPVAAGAPGAAGGGLLSYKPPGAAPPVSTIPVPGAPAAPAASTVKCFDKAHYDGLLATVQRHGLRTLGSGVAKDGRRIDIYEATTDATFAIFAIGTDTSGAFQACLISSGHNFQTAAPH